jgi:hypothetical protein
LIEIIGLPGSGKTFFLKNYDLSNYQKVIEPDKRNFNQKIIKLFIVISHLIKQPNRIFSLIKLIKLFKVKSKFFFLFISSFTLICSQLLKNKNKTIYDEFIIHFIFKFAIRTDVKINPTKIFDEIVDNKKINYYYILKELDDEKIMFNLSNRELKNNLKGHIIKNNHSLQYYKKLYDSIINDLLKNNRICEHI